MIYQKFPGQNESPLKAISENTALIIQVNRPAELAQDIISQNLLWKELTVIPYLSGVKKDIQKIDSLIKTNKNLSQVIKKYPLYLAMTMVTRSSYGFLFLSSIPEKNSEDVITGFLEDNFKDKINILKNQYGSANLVRIILKGTREPFYFAVRKGVFMGSTHPELVTKAIDQLYLNIPSLTGSGFKKVENTTGKKVDANIYVNYQMIRPFISNLLQTDQQNEAYKIGWFADWSGLDVILKKDEMLIDGFTTISDTGSQYLGIFSGQLPQKTGMISVLPDNISRFKWLGFNTIEDFYQNFQSFASKNQGYTDSYQAFQDFETKQQVVVKDYILPWMGSELCMAMALNNPETMREDPYAIMKVNDLPLADSLLGELAKLFPKRKDSISYQRIAIRHLPFADLIPGLFGTAFNDVRTNCYAFLGNYVVFGNDVLAMKDIIDHFVYGKVLEKDRAFQAVSENISDQTNVFYYFNTTRSHPTLTATFSDELNAQIDPVFDSLKKFESVALQFTCRGKIFYTSLFVHYNPSNDSQGPLEWQTMLDTIANGAPQIVRISKHGTNGTLAFDLANNLYLIDPEGTILWKINVASKPLGAPKTIYIKGSDSASFLFNTENQLFLINADGKNAHGYPVRLPFSATSSLTLADQGKNKEPSILIPLADKKVHEFGIDGKVDLYWPNPVLNEGISRPVQVLSSGNKEYIFITGKNGHLLVTDRKGKSIMSAAKNIRVSANNNIYVNKTNHKGLFLTTDPTGKVIYLQQSGRTTEATFSIFSNTHTFIYEDINNDGHYEFIFYDRNKIYFYDRFSKLIYSYSFRRDITIPPFIIELPGEEKRIGVVSGLANEIYLFNIKGIMDILPGVRGNTQFTAGTTGTSQTPELLIGSGKFIKCYSLPQ
jgi:outer membrane protein assembly factor BamB